MAIKKERENLEKMIENSKDSLDKNVISTEKTPELEMDPIFKNDLGLMKKNCIRRARSMIKRATGLMLSSNMVKENLYLKNKMQVDIISLGGLLYQLEINELMQNALMEEVRFGVANPRMFEVFGTLSRTIGDLNKQLLQTVEAIKMTYKEVKFDIKEKDEEMKALESGESSIIRNKEGIVAMGTKELIRESKKSKIAEKKIQDAEEIN